MSMTVASAAQPSGAQLLNELVQCKASIDDVVTFNELFDSQSVGLKRVPDAASLGTFSWQLPSTTTALGASSDVVMINARQSFYLIVAARNSREAVLALAQRERMDVPAAMGDDVIAQKDGPRGMFHAYTIDKTHYAAGCNYDADAFAHAAHKRANDSPAGIAQKNRMQQNLRSQ
jgi:hypothetical protein